jgi:hydrogenase assembly chaperone HypC/HupF
MCVGIPGRITEFVDTDNGLALMDVDGAQRQVSVQMLALDGDPAEVGDWVESHMGLAVAKIDEAEAREAYARQQAVEDELARAFSSEQGLDQDFEALFGQSP